MGIAPVDQIRVFHQCFALGRQAGRVKKVERLGGGSVPFRQSTAGLQISPDGAEAIAVYRISLR